jgi:DNA polymerase III subunit alpha
VMFFPATYAQVALNVAEDAIVAIKGRTDAREDTVKLIASDLTVLDTTAAPRGPVLVRMAPARCTPPMIDRLKDVLATHPGTTEVHLQLVNGDRERVLRLGDSYRVSPSAALMGDLKALLGPAAVSS